MRTAAQLQRERAADLDHANLIGVLLAEHRHRAHRLGFLQRGGEGVDREVGLHGLVGDGLHLVALLLGQSALGVEVEPQIARPIQGAGLNSVGPQYLSQRGVHHMRAGVALGCAAAPGRIHRGDDGIALDELTGFDVDPVHRQRLADFLHVGDGRLGRFTASGAGDPAGVGDLSAGFGVKRRAVEDDLDPQVGVTGRVVTHNRDPLAVDEDAEDSGFRRQFVETGELGRTGVDQFAECREVGVRVLAGGRIGLGPAPLFGHQFPEAELIDGQSGLGGHLEGELDREAVGVVQCERVRATEFGLTGRTGGGRGVFEELRARRQGAVERRLLGHRDAVDPFEIGGQFRIGRAHRVAHGLHEFAHDRAFDAQ